MPYNIGVRFKVKDFLRWTSAVFRVAAVTWGQSKSMPRRCAVDYSNKVRSNLMSYRSGRQYHPTYFKWKYGTMGLTGKGFWRLHDNLLRNIKVFPVQGNKGEYAYMGGVPDNIFALRISMYGGRTVPKEIAMYGKKAEELRPLFRPTAEQWIRAGFWESQLARSKRKIKGAWR